MESKRLADGGFPAKGRYWHHLTARAPRRRITGGDLVDWGPYGRTRANEWVTADALGVLKAARRV